jgi:hypothetical protein
VLGQKLQQPSQACRVIADAFGADHRAVLVHYRDIVVVLRPVDPTADRRHPAPFSSFQFECGASAL